MKKICVVAIPRTGTNYLCSLLGNHESILSKYEIFHNKKMFSISEEEFNIFYNETCTEEKVDTEDEKILFAKKFPKELTDSLCENSSEKILSYKIFPDHLDNEAFSNIVAKDSNTVYLIWKRIPIDSYISNQKAQALGKYLQVDTSNIKPMIDFNHYKKWHIRMSNWYQFTESIIKKYDRDAQTVYYEDFIKGSNAESLNYVLKFIRKLNVNIGDCELHNIAASVKQDNNKDYSDKVSNWEEFLYEAKSADWENRIFPYLDCPIIK